MELIVDPGSDSALSEFPEGLSMGLERLGAPRMPAVNASDYFAMVTSAECGSFVVSVLSKPCTGGHLDFFFYGNH